MEMNSPPSAQEPFQNKDQGELFQFYFHQHWIRLCWPLLRLIAWNILLFTIGITLLMTPTFTGGITQRSILALLTFFLILTHFEFLIRFYHYLLYVVVVTDKRIHRIKKTLLTLDDHQSTDLWVLQDINKRQHGLIQNLLGYGSIVLEAQDTEVRIHFTPRITEKYQWITRLREVARAHISRVEENFRKSKTP